MSDTRTREGRTGRPVRPLSESDVDRGIIARFRDVVDAQPREVAVADDTVELTYAEVASRAARVVDAVRADIARAAPSASTQEHPFGAAEPVAMVFGHDVDAVCALLGVMASGHPVLVLDPRTPVARLRRLVDTAGVRLVVSDRANAPLAADLGERVVEPLGGVGDDVRLAADGLWEVPPDPGSVAALAFTSGSTGVPKPVANDHVLFMRDAWNSSVATNCYGADDVIAHTLPLAFHAGLTTTIHGLVVGACMRLYDTRGAGLGGLARFIGDNGCTVMIASPAILRALCATDPDRGALGSLRTLTVAGEAAYGADLEQARLFLPPQVVVRNRYGSSETGLVAEFVLEPGVAAPGGVVPVGVGVGRTRLGLVGADGGSVQEGEVARLTVTAPSVALGYWGRPQETQAAFTDNGDGTRTYRTSDLGRLLPGGAVQIVGRTDHSVKVRGYLVDPGEVDAHLFGMPGVAEAVTVGVARAGGGHVLASYVVRRDAALGASGVRTALRAVLPGHMVPEHVVFLEALPRNDRGKLDRAALPPVGSPGGRGGPTHETFTHWEELVASIWMQVLGREHIGLDDDFFGLGGDSLAAEEIMTRVRDDLDVPGHVADSGVLAEAPVLRDFAARITDPTARARGALVRLRAQGSESPLFVVVGGGGLAVAFVPLVRRLRVDAPVYALQSPVVEGRGLPEWSVKSMARRHVARLRSVQPQGPYRLAGHSFGGVVAFEMVRQLRAAGQEVSLLVVLDSFPPDPGAHPVPERRGLVQRVKSSAGLVRAALSDTSGGTQAWRFFDQAGVLARRYRGTPWDGPALVVVAASEHRDVRGQWAPFLRAGFERVDVAGDHFTMIRPPYVDEVAAHLDRALSRGVDVTVGQSVRRGGSATSAS